MGDCISRQEAIDDFTKWKYQLADCFGEDYSGVSIVESAIKSLEGYPSAQPEQRRGKWIKIMKTNKSETATFYTPMWICGDCKTEYDGAIANSIIKFCYNCGADLRGEENG